MALQAFVGYGFDSASVGHKQLGVATAELRELGSRSPWQPLFILGHFRWGVVDYLIRAVFIDRFADCCCMQLDHTSFVPFRVIVVN